MRKAKKAKDPLIRYRFCLLTVIARKEKWQIGDVIKSSQRTSLTTNGVIITDAIKFVQTNKEKLTMSTKEDSSGKESNEPDYDEDKDQLEEKQEEETGELT